MCIACSTPSISSAKAILSEVSGLNLGEIQTKSFLGEHFIGEIPILFTSNQKATELEVRLAPDAIYNQLGTEKSPELNQLRFSISTQKKQPKIIIESTSKIKKPFLSFILEIRSPIGSIYQDFTVMLDPKGYNKTHTKHNKKPTKKPPPKKNTLKKQTLQYKVISGDSLSRISQRFKSSHVSLNTMMEAIHLKNPNAFINNDINRIKQGVILNLPNTKEITKTSAAIRKAIATEKSLSRTPITKKALKLAGIKNSPSRVTYKVKKGDTLSKITRDFRKNGMSFTKLMNTIYTENPHAFSKNKINLLKSGAVLTIHTFINRDTVTSHTIKDNSSYQQDSTSKHRQKANTSQPTKNMAKIDIALIQDLKSANKEIIENLEKRVRELRSELSKVDNNFSPIKTESRYKNIIRNQNSKGSKPKKPIKKLGTQHKDYYKEVEKNTSEDPTQHRDITNRTEKQITQNLDTLDTNENKKASQKNIEQIISTFLTNKVLEDNQLINVKNLSYSTLALILGLLLIRRRKELNVYTPIVMDKPLKSTSKDIIPLTTNEDDLQFSEFSIRTIKEHPYNNQTQEVFSDDTIHECEELVDDLIETLENPKKSHPIRKNHDIDIETLLNSDFSNFTTEEIAIMSAVNKKTTKTINKTAKTDTKLFEMRMDKLAKAANTGNTFEQTI